MLDKSFTEVYTKFKMHFYQKVFSTIENREDTLTTVESFCMEGIMALGHPTIAEFSRMMNISTPNAAYKINCLIQKGYVEKVRSEYDKREYHLYPTEKYIECYSISYAYLQKISERVKKRLPEEDVEKLDELLSIIAKELMPEIPLPGDENYQG